MTAAPRPSFDVPTFPAWVGELVERAHALMSEVEAPGFRSERDEEDAYSDRQAFGMLLRPAMRVGDRAVAWRLATVDEVRAWLTDYPEWWEMTCACGHSREKHSTIWTDDDTPAGEKCDECECTDRPEADR